MTCCNTHLTNSMNDKDEVCDRTSVFTLFAGLTRHVGVDEFPLLLLCGRLGWLLLVRLCVTHSAETRGPPVRWSSTPALGLATTGCGSARTGGLLGSFVTSIDGGGTWKGHWLGGAAEERRVKRLLDAEGEVIRYDTTATAILKDDILLFLLFFIGFERTFQLFMCFCCCGGQGSSKFLGVGSKPGFRFPGERMGTCRKA